MVEDRPIYWIIWARYVGERDWWPAVNVFVDDARAGWNWLYENWRSEQIDGASLCCLRSHEKPYGN